MPDTSKIVKFSFQKCVDNIKQRNVDLFKILRKTSSTQSKIQAAYLYVVSGCRFFRRHSVTFSTVRIFLSPYSMLYPVIGEPWQSGSSHWIAMQDDANLAGTLFSTSWSIGTTAGTVAGVVTMPVSPNSPTPTTFAAWKSIFC